jgi:organic hydroperoxide reductase OsmC/OhrA
LTSDVVGEIEKEGSVLVVRRIHVAYHLRIAAEKRDVAVRVHGFHADHCPLARSICGCVDITTTLELEDVNEGEGNDT